VTEAAQRNVGAHTLLVVEGDLTTQVVDAVVNAANEQLAHGGGVAAALARAGGPAVQDESDRWVAEHGPVKPGQAAVTTAGNMPARWLVHVVGPRHRDGQDNEGLLRQAVGAALDAAAEVGATSVALPVISAGIFGYPLAQAAAVLVSQAHDWMSGRVGGSPLEVRLVGRDPQAVRALEAAMSRKQNPPG
jgi:putative ATPase